MSVGALVALACECSLPLGFHSIDTISLSRILPVLAVAHSVWPFGHDGLLSCDGNLGTLVLAPSQHGCGCGGVRRGNGRRRVPSHAEKAL